MILPIIVGFLPLFLGMLGMYLLYSCLLRCAASSAKRDTHGGLWSADLQKLPKMSGKELTMGMGTECAVCLDEIHAEQPARVLPGCNHAFHLQCADTWLAKQSICPVCRGKLRPHHSPSLTAMGIYDTQI